MQIRRSDVCNIWNILNRSYDDFVAVGPLDVKILGANQPLSAGRRYDLLCQSSGSRPPASITWWKNGQRFEKTKETVSFPKNTFTFLKVNNFNFFKFQQLCFNHNSIFPMRIQFYNFTLLTRKLLIIFEWIIIKIQPQFPRQILICNTLHVVNTVIRLVNFQLFFPNGLDTCAVRRELKTN